MTDDEALAMIKEALLEVASDKADSFDDLSLSLSIEDLELDSVTTMEMVGVLEERLDTVFPDEELPKVNTLGDITTLMRGKRVGA
ncbi:MAG: hypothetical protein H6732_10730 [Alphaproteobacteria bacterium]|nr:hypothetical protein [Alphaproteobacteria bacterium]